jgi:hypothetical protein
MHLEASDSERRRCAYVCIKTSRLSTLAHNRREPYHYASHIACQYP